MAAQDDFDKAQAALEKGVQSYTFKGKTYSLKELRNDLIPELSKAAKAERETQAATQAAAKKAASTAAARRDVKKAQQNVKDAQKAFDNATKRFVNRTVTEEVVTAARTRLIQAQEVLARLTPTPTRTVTTPSKTPTTTTAKPSDGSSLKAEEVRLAGLAPKPGGGAAGGAGRGGAGAGGTGTTTTTTKKPDETKPPAATTESILDELAARFPAYQDWTLEQATAYFGSDLIKVLTDTANGVYGTGAQTNKEAIARAIEGTNYWRTTISAIRNWDALGKPDQDKRVTDQKRVLAQTFGELQLDDATLTELATTIQRTGLSELGAKQLVFGAAFKQSPKPGLDPRRLALQSSEADALRRVAKAYGFRSSDLDAQIESVLTGKPYAPTGTVLTTESFRQKAEQAARGAFPHLKEQFDSGLTLNDIFGNYREIAARVLEVDPSQVDYMSDEKWFDAFGSQKDGLPSLSSWVAKLKTDPKYGWRFTNQANQQVSSVVSALERAFGLIK